MSDETWGVTAPGQMAPELRARMSEELPDMLAQFDAIHGYARHYFTELERAAFGQIMSTLLMHEPGPFDLTLTIDGHDWIIACGPDGFGTYERLKT